jgi:uncharacterized membrane protein
VIDRYRDRLRTAAGVVAGVLYPTAWFTVTRLPQPSLLAAAVAVGPWFAAALWVTWRTRWRPLAWAGLALLAFALWSERDRVLRHYEWAFLAEHAGIMLLLALLFGRSLRRGDTPLVTRIARLVHEQLTPRVVSYTRHVTLAWTLFFVGMATVSACWFLTAPLASWATFASIATPLLVLAMFLVEYAVRVACIPAPDRAGPIDAVRAYLRYARRSGRTPPAADWAPGKLH